jgi:hypothetical protein
LIPCVFLNISSKGNFYLNHYQAALDNIRTLEAELSRFQDELALTPDDFKSYCDEEEKYLEALKEPSPFVSRKIKYVQALTDLARYQ